MKLKLHQIETIGLMIVLYIIYLCCNMWTPMVVDDCSYAATGHTLAAIWERQSHDYMTWSGRVVAHSVAQFWGGMAGKGVFNWVNPMAMCLLVWLIGRGAGSHRDGRPLTVALAALLMWFAAPDQYVTQFMIAGSMNYIWASAFILLFLQLFHRPSQSNGNGLHIILLALFALLAGCWSEMYAVCVVPAGLVWLWLNRKERPLDRRRLAMTVAYCIGAAFVVLAPGNFARMGGLTADATHTTPLATRLVNVVVFVVRSPLPWLWLAAALLWLVQRKRQPRFWRDNCFWWIAALCSIGFCVLSGATWPRTHFPAYIFSFILLVKQATMLPATRWLDHAATLAALVAIGVDFASEQRILRSQPTAVGMVKNSVAQELTPVWDEIASSRKSIQNACFSSLRDNWRNTAFAQYHHLSPFFVVPREIMDAIEKDSPADSLYTTEHYVVYRLPNSNDTASAAHVVYSDALLYAYPSKLARLATACGIPLRSRYYTSKNEAPLSGFLLKSHQGAETVILATKPDDSVDQLSTVQLPQGTFIYFPSHYLHHGNLDAIRIETECYKSSHTHIISHTN